MDDIPNGAAMWLFQYFEKKMKKAVLSVRVTRIKDRCNKGRGKLMSYAQVVNNSLQTYATDEIISEVNVKTNQFRLRSWMSPPE